jgi:hypothetical protein
VSTRSIAVAVALGVLAAAATGVALGAIPDSGGVVHACYQKVTSPNKPVKLLDTAQRTTCPSGWAPVSWNQSGPQGPAGTALAYAHVSGTSGAVDEALNVTSSEAFRVDLGNNVAEFCFNLPFTVHNIQVTPWSAGDQHIATNPGSPGHDNCPDPYHSAFVLVNASAVNAVPEDFYVLFN